MANIKEISPLEKRLDLFSDWAYDLPLKFVWAVFIYPRSNSNLRNIGENVYRIIRKYEQNREQDWPVTINALDKITDNEGVYGILLADSVALPSDSFLTSNAIISDAGGFLPGVLARQRQGYGGENKIDITFLETNLDVIDYFFRPWVIAASHKGFIEDFNDEEDIKCNITLALYTRNDESYGLFRESNMN